MGNFFIPFFHFLSHAQEPKLKKPEWPCCAPDAIAPPAVNTDSAWVNVAHEHRLNPVLWYRSSPLGWAGVSDTSRLAGATALHRSVAHFFYCVPFSSAQGLPRQPDPSAYCDSRNSPQEFQLWRHLTQLSSHHHAKVQSFHLPICAASNTSSVKVGFTPGTRWRAAQCHHETNQHMKHDRILTTTQSAAVWMGFFYSLLFLASAVSLIFHLLLLFSHTS